MSLIEVADALRWTLVLIETPGSSQVNLVQ